MPPILPRMKTGTVLQLCCWKFIFRPSTPLLSLVASSETPQLLPALARCGGLALLVAVRTAEKESVDTTHKERSKKNQKVQSPAHSPILPRIKKPATNAT